MNNEEITQYPKYQIQEENITEDVKTKLSDICKQLDDILTKENFNIIFDQAVIKYMKYRKISTLDIIASEVKDEKGNVTLNIYKSNMRSKE